MQLDSEAISRVVYLTGSAELALRISAVPARSPFDAVIVEFLNDVSKSLMGDRDAKNYSDIFAFAFWIRKSSILKLKERFETQEKTMRMGKGVVFHIAPSNVPVNFAYSLVAGLLSGNANVIRVPSKPFVQVRIIANAVNAVLEKYEAIKPYILLVRYERDKVINDYFSSVADVRVVWGGDQTIAELRKSPLPPRSGEITFADRYSLAVIDSDAYMDIMDKRRIAEDFYNDTFLTDQNACTSPRIVIWMGKRISEAKKVFWDEAHKEVEKRYAFQAIQGINKLTSSCLVAVAEPGVKVESHDDNLIIRINVPQITEDLMDHRDNSGYFYEYECKDIMEIRELCNDKRCQTIAYIGDRKAVLPLLETGIKGIDRVVPMGRTMDFDLIWDGYDLLSLLTRTVAIL